MTKKVYEWAKELGMTSKELKEKANSLGIDVKSHMSSLSEEDIEKIVGKSEKETKIVKAGPQKRKPMEQEDPKVTVKAAVRPVHYGRPRPPAGRPVINKAYLESKHKPPVGKPIINREKLAGRKNAFEAAKPELKEEPRERANTAAEPKAEAVSEPKIEALTKERAEAASKVKALSDQEHKPERKPIPVREKNPSAPKAKVPEKKTEQAERSGSERQGKKRGVGKNPSPGANKNERGTFRRTERVARGERSYKGERPGKSDREEKNERGGRYDRSQKREILQGGKLETKPSRREDINKKKRGKPINKYEKLERRSLEKQTRKKYTRARSVAHEERVEPIELPEGTVMINVPITVAGFCEQADVSTSKVIMALMRLGIMANINQNIDEDTVEILASELGLKVVIGKVEEEEEEEGIELFEDEEKDLRSRPPVITVMGHVDHGKTSLLDAIRKTNVTASESGGITQHIGASEVRINGQKIVFLDTPGHEAFAAMRARGAHITDIAVIVVAADDSVKPQTVESINHAKAAGVPIIVAINKIDKPTADPEKVKQDLSECGVLVEEWGGNVICVPVSAKTGEGVVNLLEMILLQAEMMELKANPNRMAMGSVIEARLDTAKGPVATLLVTNGTLQTGQSIIAGTCAGKIRLMTDSKGKIIRKAGPATPVEILGLTEVPEAGDDFNAVKDERVAREIAESRKEKLREEVLAKSSRTTLEQLFSQIKEGEIKELNLIIRGDVQGSVGALVSSLEKLNNDSVKVNFIHTGVGTVTESDVMLAETTNSIIIGFNVRPSTEVQNMADRDHIQIRTYRVIYDVIDDVENAMKGMLEPEMKEEILGKVEIRNIFKIPGVGTVGGAYVTEGKVMRNADIRLLRDGVVIHEGKISSLKRFKDDAREVAQGYECGLGLESYSDIKEGDVIECFHMVQIER